MKDLVLRQIYDMKSFNISDLDILLHEILKCTRDMLNADAGTIYIKEGDYLKFHIFQNDSLSYEEIYKSFYLFKDYKLPLFIKNKYLAVDAFLTEKIIVVDDIYNTNEYESSGTKEFDEKFNYKTCSIITVPLIHPINNEILGVVQLVNKKIDGKLLFFDKKDKEFLSMFSSFISLSVSKAQTDVIKLEMLNEQLEKANKELEKKVAEEILNNQNKSAIIFHQSKLSSMGELIGNIAHQWKEPLGMISTLASGLKINIEYDNVNKDNSISELMQIVGTTQKLSTMIDDFKDFYKVESIKENFNISNTIHKCLEFAEITLLKNKIEVILQLDESLKIYGLKNEFIQAMLNILNSVIDTFIEKTLTDKKRYVFINLYLKNEVIYLIIKDNTGEKFINKNKILDDKGLFMSKLIIEKYHNGSISFKDITYNYKEIDYKGIKYTITLA
ncbi:MAG: GAF domain-containing protein [Aliarcobacter sp.]|nr:GAF domain-containing protein [Aliarcobacter sp.]